MRTHFFKVKPLSDESLMYSTMLLSTISRLKSCGFKSSPIIMKNGLQKVEFLSTLIVKKGAKNQITDNQKGKQFLYKQQKVKLSTPMTLI